MADITMTAQEFGLALDYAVGAISLQELSAKLAEVTESEYERRKALIRVIKAAAHMRAAAARM